MRHIVPLSGRDSVALAWFLRKLYPDRQYLYPGTPIIDREPPELIPWLQEAARRCGGEYQIINNKGFDEYLTEKGGFLPSPWARWCTTKLKIVPMERWLKSLDEECTIYLGLRADEDRNGNTGELKGLTYAYPFVDHDINVRGVLGLVAELFGASKLPASLTDLELTAYLVRVGVLPPFYSWMSHANCYGCIFWRIDQWKSLYFRDPDRYWKYASQETVGSNFTYHEDWTLAQLAERWELERNGLKMRRRINGTSQLELLLKPLPEEEIWLQPCAACRIGG